MSDLPASLLRAVDPVALAENIGMDPDDWQVKVLRSTSHRILLNCARQTGKSTTAAVLAVHAALYEPNSLVLLLAPALRQSQELFRKVNNTYRTVGRPVAAEQESALSLTLENGSRVVCLPGKESTVRGFSGVRLLLCDEAARIDDELIASVRPMLAVSGGRMIAMSTPFGARGWWHSEWENGQGWDRWRIAADQCPRISPEFLEEERRSLGDWFFKQEYMCEFVDVVDAVFTTKQIEAAFSPNVKPLFPTKPGGA